MTIDVFRIKVTLPRRRRELLSRQRLADLWDELLDFKLILLTAPAGYGKTSYLVDIAHAHTLPFCWYSLDALDQELHRFVAYFLAAIDQRFPDFKENSISVMRAATQGGFTPEELARLCADEVYRTIGEHFVIVLDDFHLIDESPTVYAFLNRFIQDADENCHLVIASRSLIALDDLSLMVARSQVGGLGFQELSFRPEEIQALVLQNYNQVIPGSMAEKLASETEGWITGLLLSAPSIWQGMADRIRTARISGVGLHDYLLHQVLDQQPPELRDILLHTSIFEEFDSGLCETVLGPPTPGTNWQEILEKILKSNLFVLPIGDESTSLRYHHLFRDFLESQLASEQPEEQTRILRALASVYASRGDWERAYAIYQRLEDVEAITDLLEEVGEEMVKSGLVASLVEWIDSLPLVILISRPPLLALRGVAAAALGETQRGLSLLDQAVATSRAAQNQGHLARALVWKAWVQFNQSDHSTSLADADETLRIAQKGAIPVGLRADALRIRGLNLRLMGDLGKAIPSLTEALELYRIEEEFSSVARVLLALGAAYLDKGEFGTALTYYNSACDYFRKENDSFSLSSALNDLGFLHHLSGDYEQASTVLEEALVRARQSNHHNSEMLILSSLGDLFAELDAYQAAEEVYQAAREIAHRLGQHYMVLYLYLAEAALARMKGELEHSRQLLEVAEQITGGLEIQYALALYRLESGRLALAERDLSSATNRLFEAVRMFDESGQKLDACRAYLWLAIAEFEAGDFDAAVRDLGAAFHLASRMESQHILVPTARRAEALLRGINGISEIKVQARRLGEQVDRFERDIPALRRDLRRKRNVVTLTPPRLRIQSLGKARVQLDKKLIAHADWRTHATLDLFYLILSEPRGWTKETIGEILWPESSPAQLRNRFKNVIYRLRRALEQDVILFDGELYTFNRQLDYEYDVEDFWEALERAEEASDVSLRKKALREAIQIYQGDYLPEVGGTWVMAAREHLRQAYITANLSLARLHLEHSENDRALSICRDLIVKNPSLEEAHCLVMRVHAALGNRTAIKNQYHLLEQVLTEELDASPSADTQSLYQSLIR